MVNIFEIVGYEKEENRITGILVWCIERNKRLLQNIIEKSIPATSSEKPDLNNSVMKYELQRTIREKDRIVADAKISTDNCILFIENKIVSNPDINSIKIEQVERYHINTKDDNKNSWLLLITPDDKKYIEEEIFNKLNEKHSARTLWISWDDVHDICKGLIENDGNNPLNELVKALDGVILPPVGTLETEATIKLFVSAEDEKGKYWDRESINVGIIPLEKAAQILGIPTNELIKKHTELEKLEKAREEAKKIREAKK